MTCNDCAHAISMNKICEKPLQSATDMLTLRPTTPPTAFAAVERVIRPDRKPSLQLNQAPVSPEPHMVFAFSTVAHRSHSHTEGQNVG
jgi:hypothetical protein